MEVIPFKYNHRKLGNKVFLSNRWGAHAVMGEEAFAHFRRGAVPVEPEVRDQLQSGGFFPSHSAGETIARSLRNRFHFLNGGPTLHAFVLTERCNHACQYCHSSIVGMERTDTDMTLETARKALSFALQTTSPWLTIEFQGGEPTANWDVLTGVVEESHALNRRARKELSFSLVTNFSLMSEERMNWLIENRVQVCTSLDGPEPLHNEIRRFKDGNSFAGVTHWVRKFNEAYGKIGLDTTLYRVEALPTITRESLHQPEAIVDTFVAEGCRSIFLRKLDPFGFAAKTSKKLGYSMEEFLRFYARAFRYILDLNLRGTEVLERNAAIMLSKLLSGSDPNYLDLRTPGGAAIGQLAYHPNGSIYSSDEGRMVGAMGDDTFRLGHVDDGDMRALMQSPAVRSLVLAGCNWNEPFCVDCAYQPFCGLQPEYNYKSQGSLSGRMVESDWCRKHLGIFDIVYSAYIHGSAKEREILERWTTARPLDHFLQGDSDEGETAS